MSMIPVCHTVYPVIRREGLERGPHQTKMVRSDWAVEVISGELEPGETWNLDFSSAILSLSQPPTILTGKRLDGGVDSLSISGYKPQNGSGYRIPVGVLTTIIIDPVDKVFWVEG